MSSSLLGQIVQLAKKTFTTPHAITHKAQLEPILKLTNQLTPSHLPNLQILRDEQEPNLQTEADLQSFLQLAQHKRNENGNITYMQPIFENPFVTIGVFVLPQYSFMPLHNHPNMTGIYMTAFVLKYISNK
jgi:hypothetical protein